jgi:hypothetical protein
MSNNLPSHYVQQFANNIQLLLQQKDSRLDSLVMTGNHVGEQASPVDQLGAVEMQEVVGRFGPIGRVDASVDRRWVYPESYDLNQLIDSFDKLRLLQDPSSSYVMNAVAAAKRKRDAVIISAFFGTAKTGKSGSTSTTFPSGQQIAVDYGAASNVGLSVEKLIKGKELLMAADVDLEADPINCGITAKQHSNLLREIKITSREFNSEPVLVNGKLKSFLGINFVHSELFGVDGSSYRRIPMWAKSGMYLGLWQDMTTDIDQRKDLSGHPWQAYIKMTLGATRLEEEKIVEIKCAE